MPRGTADITEKYRTKQYIIIITPMLNATVDHDLMALTA